jgi:hypothetical protein
MHSMTLEQLCAVSEAGGISSVTLKGQGGAFLVQISTRSGSEAVLAKARSNEPRRFGDPAMALNMLREAGITNGQFDASEWNPDEREPVERSSKKRALALRRAHEAAAHDEWLASEIEEAVCDPRANLSHDEVMAEMDEAIVALTAGSEPVARKRG